MENAIPDNTLEEAIEALQMMGPSKLADFAGGLDVAWIEQALQQTDSASIRRRKLPAEQAVWLVLGMALFADRSIVEVVNHLGLVMPGVKSLAPSAVSQARYRLGDEPLKALFDVICNAWCQPEHERGYRGLALYAVDGTCVRVADSDENYDEFGKAGGTAGPADAGYPQLRMAGLMNLGSRMLVDANFGSYCQGEQTLAEGLWGRLVDKSLVILDRGFVGYPLFYQITDLSRQRHILARIRKNMTFNEIKALDDGSVLVDMVPCRNSERRHPEMKGTSIRGRVVSYRHPGGEVSRLFTTLLDPELDDAQALINLYHERWEIEIGFDELKTHMLESKPSLRSQKPVGVRQEIWGILIAYNLIRREMLQAADHHGLSPNRVSFRTAVLVMRSFWQSTGWGSTPGNIPKHLKNFRATLDTLFLPPRRQKRRYPRHVKVKMSNYKRNRKVRHDAKTKAENA